MEKVRLELWAEKIRSERKSQIETESKKKVGVPGYILQQLRRFANWLQDEHWEKKLIVILATLLVCLWGALFVSYVKLKQELREGRREYREQLKKISATNPGADAPYTVVHSGGTYVYLDLSGEEVTCYG